MKRDIIVIGAGVTGMTCAYELKRKGRDVLILEAQNRIGGQIKTVKDGNFTFETGPNTGVVKHPEVAELFEQLGDKCKLETALESSKKRLIWKGDKFHALPSGLGSAIATPLFSLKDKFRILGEPWRKRGTDPNESVGALAERRLGKSFVDYAVDPFLSGVYAGDPYKLPARWALPKLWALEQDYGSFVKGSIAKSKLPKTDRDKKATKKVFSSKGGFSELIKALETELAAGENIIASAANIKINPDGQNGWRVTFDKNGETIEVQANHVVTTCGAYSLPGLLPFVEKSIMDDLSNLFYAPVIQVGVGIENCHGNQWLAFGGLVPSIEKKDVLGILFPSACFVGRAPKEGASMSFFIGGVRHQDFLQKSDDEFKSLVSQSLVEMLKFPAGTSPDAICISRHERAIPQYRESTEQRLQAIAKMKDLYPTLTIAGNLRDGIGIGDRIKQAFDVANEICGA